MSRVVIAALGSLGDLFPLLSVGKSLESLGFRISIAAAPIHRQAIATRGFEFVSIGDDRDPIDVPELNDPMDTSSFVEHMIHSQLDKLFDDLLAATEGADAIVATYLVAPAHIVAEKLGIPYIACVLSPSHLVRQDNPGDAVITKPFRIAPPHWQAAVAGLRKRAGLPRKIFPYAGILTNAEAILGLFPRFLLPIGCKMPDRLRVVGYPRLDQGGDNSGDEAVAAFCSEQPVIFSFGSHVDRHNADYLFEESVAACRRLRLKCLYLSRFVTVAARSANVDSDVLVRPFVEHDLVFPHGDLIVHHAGLGTLMAACRCAKPMICVPFVYDQPFHAARMAALVNAVQLPAAQYERRALVAAVEHTISRRNAMCQALATVMAEETDGGMNAAQAIVDILSRCSRHE